MQTRKISSKLTLILYSILAVFVCLSAVAITTTSNQSMTTQAAVSQVTVKFSGFNNVGVKPYCVVTFYNITTPASSISQIFTSTNSTFNLGGATGKLEITVPMYCSVTGLTGATQNGTTYYIDVTSNTTLTAITVTFNDQGYFGGNTL